MNSNPPDISTNTFTFAENMQAISKIKINVIQKSEPCNLIKCTHKKGFRKNNELKSTFQFSSVTKCGLNTDFGIDP